MIEFEEIISEQKNVSLASIKVVGIGGAGGNTVNSIVNSGAQNIECIVANTDAQALSLSKAQHTIHIGVKSTKGLGTGANPELGKRAAEEDLDKIMDAIGDADIVFLTAGMGGGTGSGGLPIVAQALHERNILSIAVVTKPFTFEGKRRAAVAQKALDSVKKSVDTLIIIPNQKLLEAVDQKVSMIDAFAMINDVLGNSVKGISDIITKPGHINVDFADVRTIMKDMGLAVLGTGCATGIARAQDAALHAISSPLLENMSIKGAKGVLLNITGGKNLALHEISQASQVIYEQAHEDATIIIGSVIDDSLSDQVMVTVIATGFEQHTETPSISPEKSVALETTKVIASTIVNDQKAEDLIQGKGVLDVQEAGQDQYKMLHEAMEKHVVELDHLKEIEQGATKIQDSSTAVLKSEELEKVDLMDLDTPAYLRQRIESGKN